MAVGLVDNVLCFLGLQSKAICSQGDASPGSRCGQPCLIAGQAASAVDCDALRRSQGYCRPEASSPATGPPAATGGDLLTGMPNQGAIGANMRRWLRSAAYRQQLADQGAPFGTTPVEFRGKNNWQAIVKQTDFAGAGIGAFKGGATPSAAAIGAEVGWMKAMLVTGKVAKMEIGGPTEFKAPRLPFLDLPFPCIPPVINLSTDPPEVSMTEAFRVLSMPAIATPRYANKDARDALAIATAAGNVAVFVSLAGDIRNCLLSLVNLIQGKTAGGGSGGAPPPASGAGSCAAGQVLVSANCSGIGQTQFCVEKSMLGGGLVQPVSNAGCAAGQVGLRATIKGQDCLFCVDQASMPQAKTGGLGPELGGLGSLLGSVPLIAIVAVGAGLLIIVLSGR